VIGIEARIDPFERSSYGTRPTSVSTGTSSGNTVAVASIVNPAASGKLLFLTRALGSGFGGSSSTDDTYKVLVGKTTEAITGGSAFTDYAKHDSTNANKTATVTSNPDVPASLNIIASAEYTPATARTRALVDQPYLTETFIAREGEGFVFYSILGANGLTTNATVSLSLSWIEVASGSVWW
jgi:hypothetical protein